MSGGWKGQTEREAIDMVLRVIAHGAVMEAHRQGWTQREISERFHITPYHVRVFLAMGGYRAGEQ